jgi:hypothetical protein
MTKKYGPSIKNDKQYEALRDKGISNEKAARIAILQKVVKKEARPNPMKTGQKMSFTSWQKRRG